MLMPTLEGLSISEGEQVSLSTHSLTNTVMAVSLETTESRNMGHTRAHTHTLNIDLYTQSSTRFLSLGMHYGVRLGNTEASLEVVGMTGYGEEE